MNPDKEPTVLDTNNLPAVPQGWCWTTLETVCEIEGGITKDQKRRCLPTTRQVPYLRVANVQRGFLDLAEMKTILAEESEIASLRLRLGDILFTEGGDRDKLGRGWIWNGEIEECIHQNHIFRARPNRTVVDSKFVSYHGNHFGQNWFVKTGKQTTNLASINKGVLRRFPVPVAPLPEQRRIVAKIEELFSDLDAGVAALERVKAKLKRYRAAVLKAAVEGKLTEAWWKKHQPKETGRQLLDRILQERRRKWEDEQLAAYEKAGKKPPVGWKDKYKEPVGADQSSLPELPEGWCWASIEQLIGRSEYGTSVKCAYEVAGTPVLRIPNIAGGVISLADMKFSTQPISFDQSGALQRGDLLMCRTNGSVSLIGKAALVKDELSGPHSFASYLLRFRFVLREYLPAWTHLYVSSCRGRAFIESHAASSAGQHNISLSLIHGMPIPLPPLREQERILCCVDERMSIAEQTVAQIEASLKRSARLRQSILKRAFEGKLVPQDPNDEPASVLMERIEVEKTAATSNGEQKRPRKTKSIAR